MFDMCCLVGPGVAMSIRVCCFLKQSGVHATSSNIEVRALGRCLGLRVLLPSFS